ncbi:MAG TPA: hypothetical protein VER96_40755 [Polyangiaceae bacterium]|nr:hypothetical protein [Polyangiaceae bacterium]
MKTRSPFRSPALPSFAMVTNPALEQIELELVRQRRELDLALASVDGLRAASFIVDPELLEDISAACNVVPMTRGALVTLARC